jgi:hypothetical protein
MAATPYDMRPEVDVRLRTLELDQIHITQRLDRQDARINWVTALAIAAAAGGTLFGVINFMLLLQLLSRLT